MRLISLRHVLPLFLLSIVFHAGAQQKITLEDAVLKAGTDLAVERLNGSQWIPGTEYYSYVKQERLMRGAAGKMADTPIVGLKDLNDRLPEGQRLRTFPMIVWENATTFRFDEGTRVWTYNSTDSALTLRYDLPDEAENLDVHEATGKVAYTMENDLYVLQHSQEGGIRITNDGGNGIVNGKSVHREEYGIHKGTFWSPAGDKLAFYRMDESMVTTYALEDLTTRPSTFRTIRYPMAGQPSHHVTIGVRDLTGGTTFLKTGEPLDQYLTNIAWDPDGRHLHVVHLTRDNEHLSLVRYDVTTGQPVDTLLEEHDEKYLEPQHAMEFLPGRKGHQFIWRSQRDGWPHLYLYDLRTGLVRQLTKGNWVVKDLLGIGTNGAELYVSGTLPIDPDEPQGALETHLYRVEVGTGKTTRLTQEPGTHQGVPSSNRRYLIDTWSSLDVPSRIVIRDARTGRVVKTLLEAVEPLREFAAGSIELHTIDGEEGDKLNARLIKPSDFDPTRKYPVLIYVYNGPHVQLILNARNSFAPLWMLAAAEEGYLVWTVDGHGSANRGRDFEQIIHRRLGEVEVRDQMHGVAHLRSLPYVDPERIAVHGWSYGGHMTTALLARHPGVFKAGVAGGPVMDWSMYEVMYTERYMDTPAENPEGYTNTALPPLAGALRDPLLIITGGQDDVVLPQHALTFIKSCIDGGVQVEFFEYPGHAHNVHGKDRLHLMRKVLDHIDRYMPPTDRP